DYFLSFSFTINFLNGSLKTKTINCLTNETGWASASLLIPIGSDSIVVIVSFEGTYNYSSTSDQILVKVDRIVYSLEIVVPPNAKINEVLTIKVILNTTYGKISNQTIFLTISILSSSGQLSNKILNATTDINGTAYFYYLIPKDSAALTLMAEFQGSNGEYSKSNVNTVITVADWLLMVQRNLPIIILIFAIILIAIVVLLLYFKVFKPQVISLGDKRQKLILKRAETRKEIQRITDELTKERSNTISAAKEALLNDDFKTAEKLYEKAANLSLELSDKSLAKEFFSKAEEIRHKLNESKTRNTLFEQRTKFLNKARIAIQNRNVKEASEFYKKTAEISKLLGDMEAYNKYMKLAENASERIETLKAGDLRRKTGEFLNKADKLMAKQNYISAAHNFEAASRLLLKLGEEDGAEKFITWARLARERDIQEGQPSDQWITIIQNEIKNLKEKIKSALESANLKKAIEFYELMAILYTEINKPESAEKARNNAKKIEEKIEEKRVPQEINKLEELREIAFQKAQKYEAENKLAQASKYYKEAAKLSEDLGEKEIAFGYLEKAKYLIKQIKKLQETKEKAKEKAEEEEELVPKEITEAEVELAKLNISDYLKNARNALKDELYAVALYFYEKIRDAYLILSDSTKVTKTESKIKEIKAKMQIEKVSSEQLRSILPRLSSKAENLFKKQKYSEASILYYRIADIFLRLDDTDAGEHYLSRAEIAHKKSEK
ncbi:MAG: hypothetical protein ACTSXT_10875, partial [Candidatus Helarchaeota archaeon]